MRLLTERGQGLLIGGGTISLAVVKREVPSQWRTQLVLKTEEEEEEEEDLLEELV